MTSVEVDTGNATLSCLVDGAGPVVILAHGFPDCARSFRRQFDALTAAGYTAVAPFMRGYFPSTIARDHRYDAAALGGDLVALARHFSPREPVRLVGHDWGAVAAYAACALAPAAFSHVVTAAVPHLRVAGRRFLRPSQLRRSWYMAFFQLRGIAEARVRRDNFAFVDRLWRDWSPGFTAAAADLEDVKSSLAPPANLRAALGYYRAIARASFDRRVARLLLARTRVPAVYVHGRDDGCIGVELADGVEAAYAAPITVARIAGGHFAHLENADEFNALMLQHFELDFK
jgi:pimeloyl-ACP methyl ester carboxylesterase